MLRTRSICRTIMFMSCVLGWSLLPLRASEPEDLFEYYCIDCHQGTEAEGNLDLKVSLSQDNADKSLIFENIAIGKMPPAAYDQPTKDERRKLLGWLANHQPTSNAPNFRRISRHEFVHSLNDLFGTELDLASSIPEDRGTRSFDSDLRIQFTRETLSSYFSVADEIIEHAMPSEGFLGERTWVTNQLKDSHETYNIYVRDFQNGSLFSWTRANNGNSYSFFYDNFEPPEEGWYELTFDAAAIGELQGDIAIQVHAGKYYFADDRPQPQRLLDVISIDSDQIQSKTIRAFLRPGENVSVHCFSPDNFREKNPQRGAYIRQLKVRGPLQDAWPPTRYQMLFEGLSTKFTKRTIGSGVPPENGTKQEDQSTHRSSVEANGGAVRTKISIASNGEEDLRRVVRRFAQRAFSSRITDKELEPYLEVASKSLQSGSEFIEAAKLGFKAIVCSHRFLMTPGEHGSKELAQKAELARIIWQSIPAPSARDSEVPVREQIANMLDDPRADRMIQSFCDQWLDLRSWNKISPSLKFYPLYDDLLHFYLPRETTAYLAYLIRENRPARELVDSNYSFLNQRLADHYGIDGVVGQQLRKVSFNPEIPRGGLLTMGSILKVTTDGFDTSPILRGAWISRNIVGTPISPPPESVKAIEPEHGVEESTLREQIQRHKNNDACFSCHKSIDPYGFALENFDATGQWRDKYMRETPHKGTFQFRISGYQQATTNVDSAGTIEDQKFHDIRGLKRILVHNEHRIAYNFARKFFEYANGHEPNLQQRLVLLELIDNETHGLRDLVTKVLVFSITGESP